MNIGGRIIEIDHNSLQIRHIADPRAKLFSITICPSPSDGDAELGPLREFCNVLADLTVELIEGAFGKRTHESPLAHQVMLTPPMNVSGRDTKLFISGGVGYYFYHPIQNITLESVTTYDDIGPLYGLALRENEAVRQMEAVEPPETIRATVIGASSANSYALRLDDLGGKTNSADQECSRRSPLLGKHFQHFPCDLGCHGGMEIDMRTENAAIASGHSGRARFHSIAKSRGGLADYASHELPDERPLILILARDYAKVWDRRSTVSSRGVRYCPLIRLGLDCEGDLYLYRRAADGRACRAVECKNVGVLQVSDWFKFLDLPLFCLHLSTETRRQ